MKDPKISIAMATYNGQRFLPEQLASLARQTLLPTELIVTDDNSTDETPEIIAEFAAAAPFPVHLYRNEVRLGPTENFLKAASLCSGELIAFSDQDDVWRDHKLSRCSESFADSSVVMTVHSGQVVDESLKPTGWLFPKIDRDCVSLPLQKGPGCNLSGFAMVFRSGLPLLFHQPRPWSAQDKVEPMVHDQWVSFLSHVFGRVAYISEPLALYRRHAQTTTRPARSTLGQELQNSLSATGEDYRALGELNNSWAELLERSAPSMTKEDQSSATKGFLYYKNQQTIFNLRAEIYSPNDKLGTSVRSFLKLARVSGYGPGSLGGFGMKGMFKDLLVGVLGLGHRGIHRENSEK